MDNRIYLKKTVEWFKRIDKLILQISCPRSGLHWTKNLFSHYLGITFPYESGRRKNNQGWVGFEVGYYLSHMMDDKGLLEIAQSIIEDVYIVLLIRDPKNVVPSWLSTEEQEFSERSIISKTVNWNNYIGKYYTRANYILHYEDICLYPIETLAKYFEYIGIEPIKELSLESFKEFDSTVRGDNYPGLIHPVELSNEERLTFHSNSNHYELSKEQRELIWETCNDNMEKLGYWKEGNKWLDKLS